MTTATSGWRRLRSEHPRVLVAVAGLALSLAVANLLLWQRYSRYRAETERLRAGMTEAERSRIDMVIASEQNRFAVMMELVRRQADSDRELHLSVSIDSATMLLERDQALLRRMSVEVGPEHLIGTPPDTMRVVPPRGVRSISRVLGPRDRWEVPAWVFTTRGLPVPDNREVAGALGRGALLLTGGAVVYAIPDSGVLADSSFILPGAIRISRNDLRAIGPNVAPGMAVYFY
ncbi:MAG: hypothetical protein ACT4OZ_01600 [Gemmatimonadota bacterium]